MRTRSTAILAVGLLAAGIIGTAVLHPRHPEPNFVVQPKMKVSLTHLPLAFEENRGQMDPQAIFRARGQGGGVFVTATGAVFVLAGDPPTGAPRAHSGLPPVPNARSRRESAAFRMKVVGANPAARPTGLDQLPGKASYFIGNDPSQWRTDIPTFAKVKVLGVYPGIDLVYYADSEGSLEYDFVVAPGADPDLIRVAWEGVDHLEVTQAGDLLVRVSEHEVIQRLPRVFQEGGGSRREIGAAYVLLDQNQVAFRLEGRDPDRLTVIDPVLNLSRYLGGSPSTSPSNTTGTDTAGGIAIGPSGSIYLVGSTTSVDFPGVSGGYQSSKPNTGEVWNVFVVKLDGSGQTILRATFLGGNSFDYGRAIAVDDQGCAYVTGGTQSSSFPVWKAYQPNKGDNPQNPFAGGDAFVTKLNSDLNGLVYSTYLGGTGTESGGGIAVLKLNGSYEAFVVGTNTGGGLPATTNVYQGANKGGADAFIARFLGDGSNLVYLTYFGGTGDDVGAGIAVDGSGNAYITGSTSSTTGFPQQNQLPASSGRNSGVSGDAFIAKLNPTGSAPLFSTYLGGSTQDGGAGIAVDGSGNSYVVGYTSSTDFYTVNGLPSPAAGVNSGAGQDAFVARFTTSGVPSYITYLGGSNSDSGYGIAVDAAGTAYVTGITLSDDFQPVAAFPRAVGASGKYDCFVAKVGFSGAAPALSFSTYLGGVEEDDCYGVAVVSSGAFYVFGQTYSNAFPGAPSRLGTRADRDTFLSVISPGSVLNLQSVQPSVGPPSGGTVVTLLGQNFPTVPTVTFGGAAVPAGDVQFQTTQELTVKTPPHAAGVVDVTVSGGGESSTVAGAFTYSTPPTITGVNPTSGSSLGGFEVTITGADFQNGATVLFGSVAAETVTVVNATTITAKAPSEPAGTVDVTVTNPDGQSGTLAGAFTYWTQGKQGGCGLGSSGPSSVVLLGLAALALLGLRKRSAH